MVNFPSKSVIYKQPRGTVLIIGAWNYPVYLTFMPLVGALSAGNTVVLKPSDMSPITTSVIGEIIASAFRPEYITVVVGAAEEIGRASCRERGGRAESGGAGQEHMP